MCYPFRCARSYYFQSEDEEEVESWRDCLIRERFDYLRDEREAFNQLNTEFTEHMNKASMKIETATLDKERMERNVVEANEEKGEAVHCLTSILVRLGVSGVMFSNPLTRMALPIDTPVEYGSPVSLVGCV